jgi:1,4-dihydroxy-2-naphthoyl-CoA hydrolase
VSIERVREFLDSDKPGFMKLMGFRLGDYSADKVEGFVEVRPDLSNRGGVMHGGAIMAMADTLGGAGTIANLPEGARTVTIESKTNFFAAIPVGDTARGEATPLHRGRTTMVWQTKITRSDGRLAALVTQTQLVIEPKV